MNCESKRIESDILLEDYRDECEEGLSMEMIALIDILRRSTTSKKINFNFKAFFRPFFKAYALRLRLSVCVHASSAKLFLCLHSSLIQQPQQSIMSTEKSKALQPLKPDEQEAVISARLAVPDRPLRGLMARLQAIAKSDGSEEAASAIASFTLELEAYVLNLSRIEAVAQQTTVEEVRKYDEKIQAITAENQATIESIESLKKELVNVQQDRKNKLEYDSIASEIMKYGTREELQNSLSSLQEQIDTLHSESTKYTEIMSTSESRFEGIASQLEALRAEVGHEVGERERRAVERGGESDEEEEANANQKHGEPNDGGIALDEEEGAVTGRKSSLNPSAPSFKPSGNASRSSTPGLSGKRVNTTGEKRTRSSARRGGEEEQSGRSTKKVHLEEGEMSDAEDEEEEGAA